MKTEMILDLPVVGSGCERVHLSSDGTELQAQVEYLSARHRNTVTVRFEDVVAFQFRDEMHCFGFAVGSYDKVVEVIDSVWAQELLESEPKGILGGMKGKRHFAVLLSNVGYLEVIAENVHTVPPKDTVT